MGYDYEFLPYRSHLKEEIIKLQMHLWSPSLALNTAYFKWKYEGNPYLKKPLIHLAMHDGKPIGMRGFFGIQWEAGITAQRLPSLYADDMVIAPEHRHRGLMRGIMTSAFKDLAERGYDYVFNLSAGLVTLQSSLSMGWRSAGWVHPMQRRSFRAALRSGLLQRSRRLSLILFAAEHIRSMRPTESRRSMDDFDQDRIDRVLRKNAAISIKNTPNCEAMAELIERVSSVGSIRHVRDCEYLQWRFQNPLSRYRFIFWEEDRLEGYLVLQEYTSEFASDEVVNIVDWEATNQQIQEKLLETALACTKGRRLVIWSATLPQYVVTLLKENRFRSETAPTGVAPPAVLFRPVRADGLDGEHMLAGRSFLDLANWDLRMLYSMHG